MDMDAQHAARESQSGVRDATKARSAPASPGARGLTSTSGARDVCSALRVVNLVLRRAATAQEVAAALSPEELAAVEAAVGSMTSRRGVQHVLDALVRAGEIQPCRIEEAVGYLHAEAAQRLQLTTLTPAATSRRQYSKYLLVNAATSLGRAVRFCDVMEYADHQAGASDADRAGIARDIASLCRSGDVAVVREVLGGGEDGRYFYLPMDARTGEPLALRVPDEPITWLEHVWASFERCWTAEVQRALVEDRRPRPLAPGVLRARLLEETTFPQARDVKLVPNALIQLAKASPPRVRATQAREGSHFSLWAPANVPDDVLDLGGAFASDAARVIEAVSRAVQRTRCPAVGRRTIEAEVAQDPGLQPAGNSSVAALLADASKLLIDDGRSGRRQRVAHQLRKVGSVGGEAFYTVTSASSQPTGRRHTPIPETWVVTPALSVAEHFVEWLALEHRWRERDVVAQIQATDESLSPVARLGRLRVIATGIDRWLDQSRTVRDALSRSVTNDVLQGDELQAEGVGALARCHSAIEHALKVAPIIRGWEEALAAADARGLLDGTGAAETVGAAGEECDAITTDELLEFVLARGYARAARVTSPTELVPLLGPRLVRIPNGAYSGWRKAAPEYLFERTSAMLFAATEWGGGCAVLYAQFARQELGQLRDARFVLPGLRHQRFDVRLASAAALGFLSGDQETDSMLEQRVMEDPDAGVRKAALWAYGAAARPDLAALLGRVTRDEANRDVLALARMALDHPDTAWWTA